MPLQQLRLASLENLDMGKADAAFSAHLSRAVQDCLDRPRESKARTVTLTVTIVPDMAPDDTVCERTKTRLDISSSMPKHHTRVYSMSAHGSGALLFNEDSPDNVDQSTFLEK